MRFFKLFSVNELLANQILRIEQYLGKKGRKNSGSPTPFKFKVNPAIFKEQSIGIMSLNFSMPINGGDKIKLVKSTIDSGLVNTFHSSSLSMARSVSLIELR